MDLPHMEDNQQSSHPPLPTHTPLQGAAVEEEVALQHMQGCEVLCIN